MVQKVLQVSGLRNRSQVKYALCSLSSRLVVRDHHVRVRPGRPPRQARDPGKSSKVCTLQLDITESRLVVGNHDAGQAARPGNENLQILTEKQVNLKVVRFHRLSSGRKNGTSSEAIAREACERKEIRRSGRQSRPDDADQIVKADLPRLKHNNDVSQ